MTLDTAFCLYMFLFKPVWSRAFCYNLLLSVIFLESFDVLRSSEILQCDIRVILMNKRVKNLYRPLIRQLASCAPWLEYWIKPRPFLSWIVMTLLYKSLVSWYAILEHEAMIFFFFFAIPAELSCHGLFFLIISEWQLESVVVMATMQRGVWRGIQNTCSQML